ncbi:variable large family protein (plasmid) [Borrelia turicatae]|nr:variable large family protein [Borrelia turicatae]UPA15717.1 variable large family protein [Borrelia turicatae]
MVGGVLGFNTNTKKSDVGNYFKKIQETVQGTKDKLNKIVADMKSENNPNADFVDAAVKKLVTDTLDKIIDGVGETLQGAVGEEPIVSVGANGVGVAGNVNSVKSFCEGIGKIVEVVLGNKGSAEAGTDKKASDGNTVRTGGNAAKDEAGKLFAAANAGNADNAKKSAADAAKAVGAVTGADILQAMIKNDGGAAKLAMAKDDDKDTTKKDAVIAGGIALRAMAKDGKFASKNEAKSAHAANGAAASAVGKTLSTLIIAIRNTVDSGLKTISEALAAVTQEDKFADSTTPAEAATGGQQQ